MSSLVQQRLIKSLQVKERRKEEDIENVISLAASQGKSLPGEYRLRICRKCEKLLFPGKNCKVMIESERENIIYRCERCGGLNRHGF